MARANTPQTPSRATNNTHRSGFFQGPREVVLPRVILLVAVAALMCFGLVMVYSSSTVQAIDDGVNSATYLTKQMLYTLIGLVFCVAIARFIPFRWWRLGWLDIFWIVSLTLIAITAIMGNVGLGAQRWLTIGPINFQPSEFAKVAFILVMARIMVDLREYDLSHGAVAKRIILLVLIPLAFLYKAQSDLGTTIICLFGLLAVVWLAEVPALPFLGTLAVVIGFVFAATFLTGYRSDRLIFLDPYSDYYGSGYQIIHSYYAFADGGLFGVGIGNSVEKYLYLPEAETDFIFAILVEETGLVGGLVVIGLFVAILYAGIQIALHADDLFGTLVAGGATAMLVFQAFLNIGCVMGLLPTTGKPLPFISAGGSSLVGTFLLVGFIFAVSLSSGNESDIYRARRDNLRVIRIEPAPLDRVVDLIPFGCIGDTNAPSTRSSSRGTTRNRSRSSSNRRRR